VYHALFIAFHYPPEASSSGVLRTLKYTRYLPEFNWRITVITLNVDAYDIVDPELESQIPEDVRVIRTKYLNTKKHLSIKGRYPSILAIPDRWIWWKPWAVSAGKKLLKDDHPDLVYSTSPHATAHLIANKLARHYKVPLVIDFRDPWYEEPPEPDTPWLRHKINRYLEKYIVRLSSRVIASTNNLRETLLSRYSDLPVEKFQCIPNGYDEEDFKDIKPGVNKSDKLIMVHAGTINRDFRDPIPLFRAISQAIKSGDINPDNFLLRFIGPGEYSEEWEFKKSIEDNDLSKNVEIVSRLPYSQALEEISKSDVALLLQASDDTSSLVPAKLYEYFRTKIPVYALVYEGVVSDIMKDVCGGWSNDPRNIDAVKNSLIEIYELWRKGGLGDNYADQDILAKYSRRNLAMQLGDVFNAQVK
jgi:hypothetical protein